MNIYTQKELEEMSDTQLNIICTMIHQGLECWTLTSDGSEFYHCGIAGSDYYTQPITAYCNNWNDCGDLIDEFKNEVGSTIEFDEDIFILHKRGNDITVKYKNLKRAVAIAYILIKQCPE